jgi:myo-inositol catabolism protein IolC
MLTAEIAMRLSAENSGLSALMIMTPKAPSQMYDMKNTVTVTEAKISDCAAIVVKAACD